MSKVWFITGASSGLGAALAAAVLERGDAVVATFRKPAQAEAFTRQEPGRTAGVLLDLNDQASIPAAVQEAIDHFGHIDVLVNNAGYGSIGAIEEFTMEEIRAQFETNFFGMVALTKEVLPLLRRQGSGHILQLSSAAGIKATAGFGIYNASKFALEGFSEALAQEVAPFGIRVVIVEPGPFRTRFAGTSVQLAQTRLDEYKTTPVAQMYHYIQHVNGRQEGDPVKAARILVDYVHNGNTPLRLPLGKHPIDVIKAKLRSVQQDLEANEGLAKKAVFGEGS
ncbi:oxidoreductase [Flaviaesturariibacter aridisoli]|uniref:SDR family NAD(P)-dependent oxidoreductase n=1 Tax=Flaviaesturariibacter aridisoli TaxID=2545761 RepID=A0A4V2WMS8_9BACT|nr:oxidoreductase [Flaviaesturariibacter aridisoli]TCZ72802.1 SDR family NAD(P)-dependent oxidoreductase [Flaviaesturariibacter aridisoli]